MPGVTKSTGQKSKSYEPMYKKSRSSRNRKIVRHQFPLNRFAFCYGFPAGRVLGHEGFYRAYDLEWSPIGSWSTERRALRAIDNAVLQSLYPRTVDALLADLQRGLVALDQDPANEMRLTRCDADQIREISATLLEWRWSQADVGRLVARWKRLREGGE
jgi:hypothetical protein